VPYVCVNAFKAWDKKSLLLNISNGKKYARSPYEGKRKYKVIRFFLKVRSLFLTSG
jgi:hypothetical protein